MHEAIKKDQIEKERKKKITPIYNVLLWCKEIWKDTIYWKEDGFHLPTRTLAHRHKFREIVCFGAKFHKNYQELYENKIVWYCV